MFQLKQTVKTVFKFMIIRLGLYHSNSNEIYRNLANKYDIPEQVDGFVKKHDILKPHLETQKLELKEFLAKYHPECKTVLDYGCGTGRYLKLFEKSNLTLIGVDACQDTLEKFTSNNVSNATLLCADFVNEVPNELGNQSIDFFYSIGTLQHIKRTKSKAFFNKVYNLLNYEGVLCLLFAPPKDFFHKYESLNYYRYSPKELMNILKKTGFQILDHKASITHTQALNYLKDEVNYGYIIVAKKK